ncbi:MULTISPECIES: glycosyltransferase [Rhodomicrobium]|uniref:glycosyltransferase n=1 Tax=Rhodomicrobium TaxID=1068 RepID=UPI000B4B218D|nr:MULTISPECIES: glycosyltransferase [Rhodomicrobium]
MTVSVAFASAALAAWLYLIFARGGFWRADMREEREASPEPQVWPRVVAVVPARNEADVIAESLGSLLQQDYPGSFEVILVDDQSTDATAANARAAAARLLRPERLVVVEGEPLPQGWAGKLWAMKQGVDHAGSQPKRPDYLLFTDADIAFAPDALRHLVSHAEARDTVLTSWMVKLRCESLAERGLIPAFVFFFQMLYPFAWVNRPDNETAAAAGGCMLVRRDALTQAGGIEAIRNALIDDCALGERLKSVGPVWLGLTERAHSLRPYPDVGDIRRMVARSAYDQLGYSPLVLAGVALAMTLIFLLPPLYAVFGTGLAQSFGALAWVLMAFAFQPILRFYRLSPLWGLALPAIAALYLMFTLDSAYQYMRGRGGLWKGRVQARRIEGQ